VVIGNNVKLKNTIVDRGCQIPDGMEIGFDRERDIANGFRVTDKGIVLVTRPMLGQKGTY